MPLMWFVFGALILRLLAMPAWMFFPEHGVVARAARVLIPLLVAVGLILLNRTCLARSGFARDSLGFGLRRLPWVFVGAALIAAIVLAIAAVLWLQVPFHWERGAMSWAELGWKSAEYLSGNTGEELMFRGFFLVILARYLGLTAALIIGAVTFGLFHLPGLSGIDALKMICTTGAMSFTFAFGYVLTGSLWTAVGLHAFGNSLLHEVFGMSGKSGILKLVFDEAWPTTYDPGFVAMLSITIPLALIGALLVRRFGSRWPRHVSAAR